MLAYLPGSLGAMWPVHPMNVRARSGAVWWDDVKLPVLDTLTT